MRERARTWRTAGQSGRAQASASGRATTIALDLRRRLKASASRRHQHQGRRGAARAAGAGDAAGRNLRTGCGNAPRGHRRDEEDLRRGAIYRRYRRFDRRAAAAAATLDRPGSRWNFSASSSVTSTTPIQTLFGGVPSATPTAARTAIRSRSRSARQARSRLDRAACLDAGARQHAARQQNGRRAGPGRERGSRAGFAVDFPPRRPVHRHGDGGTRRPLRGAALWHARSGKAIDAA